MSIELWPEDKEKLRRACELSEQGLGAIAEEIRNVETENVVIPVQNTFRCSVNILKEIACGLSSEGGYVDESVLTSNIKCVEQFVSLIRRGKYGRKSAEGY